MRADVSQGYSAQATLGDTNAGLGPRCNDGHGAGVGLSTCLCIHAEENALLEAGERG
jgi:dCMP deaminase